MDSDLLLVFGVFICLLSLPVMINAFSSDRSLQGAIALLVVGCAMILFAQASNPARYRPGQLGEVFMSVFQRIVE
ncbi:hypothetical protein [Albidovulum sp.]|uniref:hypothetical protein n=1 Tax=Albidovulum sp. TaxID=1872424 RepID=UPI001DC91CAB|nr:hypothetical protein [Paracoccaceae bacterium]